MAEKKISLKKFEYPVFTIVMFLAVFGLIVLYSASNLYALKTYDNQYYIVIRQMIFFAMGIVTALFLSFIPSKVVWAFSKYIYITVLVLVLVTTFAGRMSRGVSRWIELRGVVFQPSELMKIALLLHLSKLLGENRDKLNDKEVFLKIMLVAYVPVIVVALNNLSTGIILFLLATFLIFIVSKKYFIFIVVLAFIVLFYMFSYPMTEVLLSMGLLKKYQAGRIFAWKAPLEYKDLAYQTLQGLYALGSGKMFGRGYLNSIQKVSLPEAHNDMIWTVLCEELGFVGAIIFIVLYLLLIYRIFTIAFAQKHTRTFLFTFGVAMHIAIQVILNICVCTFLLPNTGVTLPFVSYGGSSLIALCIEIGLVMSISKYRDF